MTENEPRPARCLKTGFVLPDNISSFPHDDGYRARRDVWVNHGFRDHTLRPDRKGTTRERWDGCFRPFRAPQSLKSIASTCSSPCRVVGAAFSSGTRNPTKIYDNHYAPEEDLRSPQMTDIPSPRYGPKGAAPASRPLGFTGSEHTLQPPDDLSDRKTLPTALLQTPTPRPSDRDSWAPEGVLSKAGQGS